MSMTMWLSWISVGIVEKALEKASWKSYSGYTGFLLTSDRVTISNSGTSTNQVMGIKYLSIPIMQTGVGIPMRFMNSSLTL